MNFNLPDPKDAAGLVRYARASEAARKCVADGYMFETDAVSGVTYVYKPEQGQAICTAAYEIWPADSLVPGCTCPDFVHRGSYCKHMLAVHVIEEGERDAANCDRFEREEENAEYLY